MSSREERVKVFEDTMKWCQDDDYLSASIDAAKKATKVYYEYTSEKIPSDVSRLWDESPFCTCRI